jgi:hypothetical protein
VSGYFFQSGVKILPPVSDINIRHAGKQCKTDGSGHVLGCFFVLFDELLQLKTEAL